MPNGKRFSCLAIFATEAPVHVWQSMSLSHTKELHCIGKGPFEVGSKELTCALILWGSIQNFPQKLSQPCTAFIQVCSSNSSHPACTYALRNGLPNMPDSDMLSVWPHMCIAQAAFADHLLPTSSPGFPYSEKISVRHETIGEELLLL